MDLNGFSSPRSDRFPAGLRVLVVDDDPTWLKILEKMLKKCNYEVTTCSLARDALNLLRERKDGFDIVISDVTMPDMDGFKLLEHVGLEMDLPVIMMSVDGETSRVMKGVQHGACDYLLKPIRMKELRNIWQHVFRKRMHEVRDVEIHDSLDEVRAMMRHGNEPPDDVYLFNRDTTVSGKRRKDDHHNKYDDRVSLDSHSSAAKKARVVWSVDLHQKFVKAVNQIGFDKVGPKKILDLMGVPWLTRENVASHLQKYRLYLSRLEKEREQLDDAFAGIIQHSSSRSPQDFDLGHKIPPMVHELDPKVSEPNSNVVRTISVSEPEKHLIIDKADVSRKITSSRLNVNHRVDSPNSCVESEVQPTIQLRDSTSSVRQFKNDRISPHNQPHLSRSKSGELVNVGFEGSGKVTNTKVESTSALFSVQPENLFHATEQIQSSMWTNDVKSFQGSLDLGTGSFTRLWDEEFDPHYSSEVDYYQQIDDFGNIEPLDCSRREVFGDAQTHIYAPWNFDCEYLNETVEYPIMDRGLFIA